MTEFVQYSLFDDSNPKLLTLSEKVDGVEWSYSKRDSYEQCPLRYYFNYYGSSKTFAKAESRKQELQFIKQRITNRYLLSGSILHLVIKTYFKYAKQGNIWSADKLQGFAQKIFHETWAHSRMHPTGDWFPDVEYPPHLLKEYYQGLENAEQLCKAEEDRLLVALETFATSSTLQEFREFGRVENSLVEAPLKLSILGCRVSGKIDLAYNAGEDFYIVDWKIGKSDDIGETSLQMAVYGLWAVQSLNYSADKVRVCKAFLSTGEVTKFKIDDIVLSKARIQILQDAERMALMHKYGQNGEADGFTPRLLPTICSNCVYERLCYG